MTMQTEPRSTDSGRLSDAARNVAKQAEQTVEAKASTTMDQVSTAVEGVAQAIRRAGEDLRKEQPQLASVADTAAEQVDRVADYLVQHEPREVFGAAQDAARRQPALLIGGGIALGLIVGRLLRTAVPAEGSAQGSQNGSGRSSFRYDSTTGNGGSRRTDPGDAGASIVAGTRVVQPGSPVETGTANDPSRR